MKQSKYTKENLEPLVKQCKTFSDVLRMFTGNSKVHGGSSFYLRQKIKEFNIDISHFDKFHKQRGNNYNGLKYTKQEFIEKFLTETPLFIRTSVLKNKLIEHKLKEYKCEICGNFGEWMGRKLTLQLDHINGISNDNRLENLRVVCPNCHTQTDTYCGKNNVNN